MNEGAELSTSQILEHVKSDRVTLTKAEEDRRRRTIIVEKRNGSYGFTLQSYGIHYKKEQEIEMITYVDHVDYDGPAFRAGMREGDVILSINGRDMEKVDHKSLVNFIKSCDTRMRMVVLFEDCVRKVELHMRYIKLQNALKAKTLELEKLCVQEKELLSGKWKTHSLPARKKNNSNGKTGDDSKISTDNEEERLNRPTVSTEDVGQAKYYRKVHHHLMIAYPHYPPYYIDSHGRAYYLYPSNGPSQSSSKEYLIDSPQVRSSRQKLDRSCNNFYQSHRDGQSRRPIHGPEEMKRNSKENLRHCQVNNNYVKSSSKTPPKYLVTDCPIRKESHNHKIARSRSYHQNICGGCLRGEKNNRQDGQENGNLEAYDLAGSPCCNAQCVPIRRRRSHSHHIQKLKPSSSKTSLQSCSTNRDYSEGHSNRSTQVNISTSFQGNNFLRKPASSSSSSSKFEAVQKLQNRSYRILTSQNSLHSCASSELPISQSASYVTSLSTDTLYWDQPSSISSTRKHSTKSSTTSSSNRAANHRHESNVLVKPVKSCDNLTTAASTTATTITKSNRDFDTGCDYLDQNGKCQSTKNISEAYREQRAAAGSRYFNSTKSSESLFYSQNLSDASLSCEYLDQDNPTFISNGEGRFVPVMPSDWTNQRDKASQTDSNKRLVDVLQTPEVTRL